VIGHSAMMCGNKVFRKHDVGGEEFPACYFCRYSCFVAESDKSSFSAGFRVRFGALPAFSARGWSTLAGDELDVRVPAGWVWTGVGDGCASR
jgi:hypothetical protein